MLGSVPSAQSVVESLKSHGSRSRHDDETVRRDEDDPKSEKQEQDLLFEFLFLASCFLYLLLPAL